MKIAGSDLALHTPDPTSGEYTTEWNTTGINATKKGKREDIALQLTVWETCISPAEILMRVGTRPS